MVRDAFGPRWAIVPYVMPGFALAKLAAEVFERDPDVEGLVLLNHGLFTFADDARTAYERMIAGVDRAERFVRAARRARRGASVAGASLEPAPADAAARLGARRCAARSPSPSGDADRPWRRMVLEHRASDEILALLRAPDAAELARVEPAHARSRDPHQGTGALPRRPAARRRRGAARAASSAAVGGYRARLRRLLRGQPRPRAHADHEARLVPARGPRPGRRRLRRRAHQGTTRASRPTSPSTRSRAKALANDDRPLHGARRRRPVRHGVLEPRAGEARQGEGAPCSPARWRW